MADRETWTSTNSPEPTLATGLDLGVPRGPVVYLLVLEGDTSTVFPLPVDGEVVIGRGDGVSLRLRDQSISRAHARVTCRGGQAEVADLGSQNGTRLNGDALIGTRKLVSGDAIAIGAITMVFHSTAKTRASRALISLEGLRARLEEEVDRATRGGRSLAVIALVADAAKRPGGVLDTVAIVRLADGQLRRADVIGQASAELFYALLPDVDAAGGKTAAGHLVRALYRDAPNIRAGVAACPADGIDVDALLAGARAAAEDADAGEVALASTTYRTLDLGGRQAIVADAAMMRTFALVERLAKSDLSVLVCGETGTGKDVIASAVHHGSARARGPMVTLNCAAVPETLAESELFGHERGAFSGAVTAKLGILEAGHGGTVFLDEIGELPLAIQAKLLRALETRRITRVGDVAERAVDFRLVAATNRNLTDEVAAGRFRQDLLFRIGGATVWLPPLRDRPRELPILASAFLAEICARAGRPPMAISDEAMAALLAHPWPGNVREMRQVMDYVVAAYGDEREVAAWHVQDRLAGAGPAPSGARPPARTSTAPMAAVSALGTGELPAAGSATEPPAGGFRPIDEEIRELEKLRMGQALAVAQGNQTIAADLIKMPLRTFQAKAKAYGLRRKDK
jgi:DNA-binding NtrC family response regulator/pSer/pThr/pTyr-binding forkhead associated (FHA) protein